MILAFVIWSLTALIYVMIGLYAWRSEQAVGFFTFAKPAKMKDVVQYNHAVGKLWFVFAVALELLGIPLLFAEQNSPVFVPVMFGVILLVLFLIVGYLKIERKYKEQ